MAEVVQALGWDDEQLMWSCVVEESEDGEEWYMPDTSDILSEWLTVELVSGNQKMIDFMLAELDEEDYSDVSCQIFITPILKSANLQLLQSTVNLFLHQEDYFESFVRTFLMASAEISAPVVPPYMTPRSVSFGSSIMSTSRPSMVHTTPLP